jgi:hypothetical protein
MDVPAIPSTYAKTTTVKRPSSKCDFMPDTKKVRSVYKGDNICDDKTVLSSVSDDEVIGVF